MKTAVIFDMPESCNNCFCADYDSRYEETYCRLDGDEKEVTSYVTKRPEWCPLRPLPDGFPLEHALIVEEG